MEFLQILVLAVVQGLTEFLPVSSSAHLVLVPWLTNWEDQGLVFDVAVHFGTLIAVVYYFREQLSEMVTGTLSTLTGNGSNPSFRLACLVVLATIPAIVFGALFHTQIELYARSPIVIAVMTIVFGVVLFLADRYGRGQRKISDLNFKQVLLIGVAQAIAMIPGTSRSGITISAALAMGYSRQSAARFSFLMSIPVILAALVYQLWSMRVESVVIEWGALVFAVMLSAISAYLCIHVFLKLLERVGMLPFVIYRLVLGVVLLVLFY